MNFRKHLYLPSGGLSYSPFAWAAPITNEIQLFQSDPNNGDSLLEYQVAIINKYTELPVKILDLYIQDLNYIWMYFLMAEFITTGSYYIHSDCVRCKHKNLVAIDISKINAIIHNKYKQKLLEHIIIPYDEKELIFDRRRVKHSLEFGNLLLNSEPTDNEDLELLDRLTLFMATQFKELKINGTPVESNEYVNFFLNISYDKVLDLYIKVMKAEEVFGIESEIQFKCKKCEYLQSTFLFNNIASAVMNQIPDRRTFEQQEKAFEFMFSVSRLPIMNYDEVSKMPIRYSESMARALGKIEWTPGGIM